MCAVDVDSGTVMCTDDVGAKSKLEMCSYIGCLREPGNMLHTITKKKGDDDIMIKVPAMG
jgi:hypothetical protein